MSKGGRPKAPLTLNDDERQKLEAWASRPKSTQRLATRARIILASAEGLDNKAVAARLHVNIATVGKWRGRFLEDRLEGLADEPRPGAPRQITDARVEEVVTKTLEEKPKNATGVLGAWPRPSACRKTRSSGSGTPSASSPIRANRSSCRPIPTSSRRSATWSACT